MCASVEEAAPPTSIQINCPTPCRGPWNYCGVGLGLGVHVRLTCPGNVNQSFQGAQESLQGAHEILRESLARKRLLKTDFAGRAAAERIKSLDLGV